MKRRYCKHIIGMLIAISIVMHIEPVLSQEVQSSVPMILVLKSQKDRVKRGEAITFFSAYALPKGTYKVEEKWSYRPLFLEGSEVIFEKPAVLFEPGEYEITLEIKNNEQVWSKPLKTYITVTKKCKETELNYIASKNIKGEKLNRFGRENYRAYKKIEAVKEDVLQGKLMVSNSPEKVKEKGVLYEGTSKGDGRFLIHHLHEMEGSKDYRIVVLVTNLSDTRQRIAISNWTLKGPSSDVLYVGQQLLQDYWDEYNKEIIYDLPKGETGVIYKQDIPWNKGEALSAYMDFHTDGEVKWQVLCVENGDNLSSYNNYCVKDEHIRGTFDTTKVIYHLDLGGETSYFAIGDKKEEFLIGPDEMTGEEVSNRGNFGVVYEIHVKASQDMLAILSPRGDIFKGAIKWQGKPYAMPNKGCLRGGGEGSFLGLVKEGEEVIIQYMLPNGSSAPVIFVFVPRDKMEKMSKIKENCKANKPC